MKVALPLLLSAAAVLVGCGSESNSSAVDASVGQSTSTTDTSTGTNSGGSGSSTPVASPSFTLLPAAVSQQPYAQFAFTANAVQGFQCQLDDGYYQDCSSPYLVTNVAVGEHHFAVRSVGNAGQYSDAVSTSWQVASIFGDDTLTSVHADLTATAVQPDATDSQSWRGIFRINCDFAHGSYNDPIVYPGQADAAHLHRFYGNTLTDHNTTMASLVTSGESSCQGNTLNRSAYWVPALLAPAYDTVTEQRLVDAQGQPAWNVVPAVVGNDDEAHEIFYYSAGVDDLNAIQAIPLGLKMIAGNPMAQPGSPQDTSIVRWHCQSWASDEVNNPRWSSSIPECVAPDRLRMDIFFPSCWNGVDLDSLDHRSHMAYPVNNGGPNGAVCPSTHPVPIIWVSFHYAYGVKPDIYEPMSKSSRGWRFASDMYEVSTSTPGGMSLHGDWFNAWHPQALQAVLAGCIRNRLDCHDGNLANGYRLVGTRPGSQTMPAVVNEGLGN